MFPLGFWPTGFFPFGFWPGDAIPDGTDPTRHPNPNETVWNIL